MKSEYETEQQWRVDAKAFLLALCKHWSWCVSSTVGSGAVALWQDFGTNGAHVLPVWSLWLIALSGIVIASFRAFQDQKRSTEAEQEKNAALNSEIQKLKQRKAAKDALGQARRMLQERIEEVQGIDIAEFHRMYEHDGKVEDIDPDSAMVLKEVADVLREHFSDAEVALFKSNTGVDYEAYNSIYEIKQGTALTWLIHRARQLDKIIEKQI